MSIKKIFPVIFGLSLICSGAAECQAVCFSWPKHERLASLKLGLNLLSEDEICEYANDHYHMSILLTLVQEPNLLQNADVAFIAEPHWKLEYWYDNRMCYSIETELVANPLKKHNAYFTSLCKRHITKLREKYKKKLIKKETSIFSKASLKGVACLGCSLFFGSIVLVPLYQGGGLRSIHCESNTLAACVLAAFLTYSAAFGHNAAEYFKKAWRHKERVLERLQRDKKILALLEQIRDA